MDFNEQIRLLQAAGNDPESIALATLDIVLATHPEGLRRAIEAVAVPHWFTEPILRKLLDEDQQEDVGHWYDALSTLPAVEPFPARNGFNVHEATRLALRKRLATESRPRFEALTARAVSAFSSFASHDRIERLFHRLVLDPNDAANELRELEYDLRAEPEDRLALAVALQEYDDEAWPGLVRGWAVWLNGSVRREYLPIDEILAIAESADRDLAVAGDRMGIAVAKQLLGDILVERSQSGDAERALAQFEESLRIRKQLYEANPNSAQAARDVSVSLNKLGDFYVARGQSGDAERALAQFEESLRIRKQLYEANPNSAQAARDVLVSLERMADVTTAQGDTQSLEQALRWQEQAMALALKLRQQNPTSLFFGRTAAVTLWSMAQRAQAVGQQELAGQCLSACHTVLHELITASMELDEGAKRLYEMLHASFE